MLRSKLLRSTSATTQARSKSSVVGGTRKATATPSRRAIARRDRERCLVVFLAVKSSWLTRSVSRTSSRLADLVALGFEVDHDVRDRDLEPLARARRRRLVRASASGLRDASRRSSRRRRRCGARPRSPAAGRRRRPRRAPRSPHPGAGRGSARAADAPARAPSTSEVKCRIGEFSAGCDDQHLCPVALGLPADLLAQRSRRRRSRSRPRGYAARPGRPAAGRLLLRDLVSTGPHSHQRSTAA